MKSPNGSQVVKFCFETFKTIDIKNSHLMINTRNLSGISGTSQNPISSYTPILNSYHCFAHRNNVMIGYVLARLYHTKSLMFNSKAYFPVEYSGFGNTLVVNEIVVLQSEQRTGIGSQLLDYCLNQLPKVKEQPFNVEFSVLSTNLSSEIMFNKFALRNNAHQISIGHCSKSAWGNYIDWTIEFNAMSFSNQLKNKLLVKNSIFDYFSYDTGYQGYLDRKDLIQRTNDRI
ncbi:hypothetical protein BC833DRAFT_583743 [Globomyces pollinis-pini]|nr:hypothetical protein BC833DRAFT_583743 [Globomyces pollinis-pini]